MGGDSTVNQSSLLGLAAGGDKEVHDEHKSWTSKYTEHYETGIVIHVTSGTVQHANLNLSEVHATANVLTMHLDLTPLNVHLSPQPLGIDVHIEASHFRKHVNVHGGHHHQFVSDFHQESQAVHIKSTTRPQTGWDKKADLAPSAAAGHEGTMTLEADGKMRLRSREMRLDSGPVSNPKASLELRGTDGEARLFSKTFTIDSQTQTIVTAGVRAGLKSTISLEPNSVDLRSGRASVTLNGNKLTTSATGGTRLTGKVSLGEPTIIEELDGREARALAAAAEEELEAAENRRLFEELPRF